jgi:hypothetical protein
VLDSEEKREFHRDSKERCLLLSNTNAALGFLIVEAISILTFSNQSKCGWKRPPFFLELIAECLMKLAATLAWKGLRKNDL